MCYAEKCLACEQFIDKHLAGLVLIASLYNSFMANISMKILLTVCHTFLIIFFEEFVFNQLIIPKGNLVLSTELIMKIGYCKEFKAFKLIVVANLCYQLS